MVEKSPFGKENEPLDESIYDSTNRRFVERLRRVVDQGAMTPSQSLKIRLESTTSILFGALGVLAVFFFNSLLEMWDVR